MECLVLLLGYENVVVAGRTVASSDTLAKARLAETG